MFNGSSPCWTVEHRFKLLRDPYIQLHDMLVGLTLAPVPAPDSKNAVSFSLIENRVRGWSPMLGVISGRLIRFLPAHPFDHLVSAEQEPEPWFLVRTHRRRLWGQ